MFEVRVFQPAILIALLFVAPELAFGWMSFTSSGTLGVYRDAEQRTHYPVYYTMSYTGLHGSSLETRLDVGLNNDLAQNQWRVVPSQMMISVALSEGWTEAPFRRTRVQLGRQLFTEGFDMGILDGVQIPLFWSSTGGISLYGGVQRSLDFHETLSAPLAGLSVFESVGQYRLRFGYAGRGDGLSDGAVTGFLGREFATVPLQPEFSTRAELDQGSGTLSQVHAEAFVRPVENTSLGVGASRRRPRSLTADRTLFVYDLLSASVQESQQVMVSWSPFSTPSGHSSDRLRIQGFARFLGYEPNALVGRSERGYQQELSAQWNLDQSQWISPLVGHVSGYGGTLWDLGISYGRKITDGAVYRADASIARLEKIDRISGWAYHLRNRIELLLGPRLTASSWLELERNHLFDFDARIIATFTYFH